MALEGLEEVTEEVPPNTSQGDELIDIKDVDNQEELLSDEFNACNNDIDEQLETVATLESMINSLKESTNGITPNNYKPIQTAVEHLCSRINYTSAAMPAMEAFGGSTTKLEGTQNLITAMEGIVSTVWEGIKKAFLMLVNIVKKFLMWFFGIKKNTEEKAKVAEKKISELKSREKTEDVDKRIKEALERTDGYLMAKGTRFATFFGYQSKDPSEFTHNFPTVINSLIRESFKRVEAASEDLNMVCSKWADEIKRADKFVPTEYSGPISTIVANISAGYSSLDKLSSEVKKHFLAAVKTTHSGASKDNTFAMQMPFDRTIFYIHVKSDHGNEIVYFKPGVYKEPYKETIPSLPALDLEDAVKIKHECDSIIKVNTNAERIDDLHKTLEKIISIFQGSANISHNSVQEATFIKNLLSGSMTAMSDILIYKEKIVNNALDYCIASIDARSNIMDKVEKEATKSYMQDDDVEDVLAKGEPAHDYYSRKAA